MKNPPGARNLPEAIRLFYLWEELIVRPGVETRFGALPSEPGFDAPYEAGLGLAPVVTLYRTLSVVPICGKKPGARPRGTDRPTGVFRSPGRGGARVRVFSRY